jgi:hypothetical protein
VKGVGYALAGIGGLLAGAILGVIVSFFTMALLNNGTSSAAPIAVQVVLDVAVAFCIYRTLVSKDITMALRVFLVAIGTGVLGALVVCTAIVAGSNAH